jgi:hypothetical protein
VISNASTLDDIAFAVCTALERVRIEAVLTGGSAAAHYAPSALQSYDADFVLRFGDPSGSVVAALASLGFNRHANGFFEHASTPFTVEFPAGPLAVGSEILHDYATEYRGAEILRVLSPTDAVRDRFMAFFAWGDISALHAALTVAWAIGDAFYLDAFERWAKTESARDASYPAYRLARFLERYHARR